MTPTHDDQVQILAEDTARLIDFAGRVLAAVEEGSWERLAEKSAQLAGVANRLSRRGEYQAQIQYDGDGRVTGAEVIDRVRVEGRHYWLGRRLYPQPGGEA